MTLDKSREGGEGGSVQMPPSAGLSRYRIRALDQEGTTAKYCIADAQFSENEWRAGAMSGKTVLGFSSSSQGSLNSHPLNTMWAGIRNPSTADLISATLRMPSAKTIAALGELRQVTDEARAEGLEPPSVTALAHAERILGHVCALTRVETEVYPLKDGEVVVDTGRPRHSVAVICDSDGGARCLVNLDGRHRRAIYDSAGDLPDGFLSDAIRALNSVR